jgi:hypothetical protein
MFQYLQGFGLLAGYIASLFALAGWAWFQRFFKELGINIDAINYESSITRVDYYIRPGAEAIRRLMVGDFWKNIKSSFSQEQFIFALFALGFIILLYLYVRIRRHNRNARRIRRSRLTHRRREQLSRVRDPLLNLNFLFIATGTFAILLFSLMAIKAGEWAAIDDVRNLASDSLPRVQILFKKDTISSSIKKLDELVLRKIFIDRANVYGFLESERQDGVPPPIYVISLSEISQMRLVQNPAQVN